VPPGEKFTISSTDCIECGNVLLEFKYRSGEYGCTGCGTRFRRESDGELTVL
jgi:ribosomal protein S27E